MTLVSVRRAGVVPYADALEMQRALVEARKAGRIGDTLVLLQHPHVVTIGVKRDGRRHIVATPERLAALGVEVFESGRGGDVTYHGPGQLVAYPILDLDPDRRDVHRYVRDLEEVMIRTSADYGLEARRLAGMSGAWVDPPDGAGAGPPEKIGAIGVRISRWVTSHGLAYNVTTDLDYFGLIVPCGLAGRGVTSLSARLGRAPDMAEVESRVVGHFCDVFGRRAAVDEAP